jgi:hypothetical protein
MRYRFQPALALALVLLGTSATASAMSTATLQIGGSEISGDTGTITVSFTDSGGHFFSEAVTYGAYSTPASIAAAFGGRFSNQYLAAGLCVHASGSQVFFQLKNGYVLGQPTINDSSPSFSVSSLPPSPVIIGVIPNVATVGAMVIVNGQSFGDSQGTSVLSLNGASIAVASWSNETITFAVPNGAASGNIVITVNGSASNAVPLTITGQCPP